MNFDLLKEQRPVSIRQPNNQSFVSLPALANHVKVTCQNAHGFCPRDDILNLFHAKWIRKPTLLTVSRSKNGTADLIWYEHPPRTANVERLSLLWCAASSWAKCTGGLRHTVIPGTRNEQKYSIHLEGDSCHWVFGMAYCQAGGAHVCSLMTEAMEIPASQICKSLN